MLGKEIAIIYVICGVSIPIIIGILGNLFGGEELISKEVLKLQDMNIKIPENNYIDKTKWYKKLYYGIIWGFNTLGIEISRFILVGTFLGTLLIIVIPQSFVMQYLSNPRLVSIAGITAIGCIMYVCALGHIPFIAALISAGASPGIAITFLITGVATNISELISIYKLIGKRSLLIYILSMLFFGISIGYLTNILLFDNFTPIFNLSNAKRQIEIANNINIILFFILISLFSFKFRRTSFKKVPKNCLSLFNFLYNIYIPNPLWRLQIFYCLILLLLK